MFRTKVLGNSCSGHLRKAQAIWFKNTLLLPHLSKPSPITDLEMLPEDEKVACPLFLWEGIDSSCAGV